MKNKVLGGILCAGVLNSPLLFASATWTGATSGNWNTGTNWSTNTVPTATATFGSVATTSITISQNNTSIGALQFNTGASAYTLNPNGHTFTINGTGVTNSSTNTQTFNITSGTLTFSNGATSDNASITNSGTLNFDNTSTAGTSTITNNSALNFNNTATASTATIVNNLGGTIDISGTHSGTSIGSISGDGGVNLGSRTLTIGDGVLSGAISGDLTGNSGDIIKEGTGTLTLTGNNTYKGGTTLTGGTININNASALGSNSLTFNVSSGTGTLQFGAGFTFANDIALNTNGTIDSNNFDSELSAKISGSGGLTKIGSGTLTVSYHNNNQYSGTITMNAGVLAVSAAGNLGSTSGLIFDGGTLEFTTAFNTSLSVSLTGAGTIQIDSGSANFSGPFTGTGALFKTGAGTLNVSDSNNNTYSGATTVSAGIFQAGSADSFSPNSAFTLSGGILDLNNFNQTIASLTGSSNTTLGSGILTTGGNNSSTSYSGAISGTGGVTKQGTGTFTLTGTSNTYSGPTTVNAGIFQASAVNSFSPNSAFTLSGGTLDLNNFNQTIGSLAGSSNTTMGSATLTTGGDNSSTSYSGVISGTGGLIKQGTGAFTLAATNTYTGLTQVNQGTLIVNGLIPGNVNVASGATLKGTGSIQGTANVTGTISPGNSIGTLTVGNVDFSSGGTYNAEFSAMDGADFLNVTGTATLTEGTLNLVLDGLYNESIFHTTYTILTSGSLLTTRFSRVTTSLDFLYAIRYTNHSVLISEIKPRQGSYSGYLPAGTNPNAVAVARYFDPELTATIPADSDFGLIIGELDEFLLLDDPAGLAYAFDQIQPAQLASTATVSFQGLTQRSQGVSNHQKTIRNRKKEKEINASEVPESQLYAFNRLLEKHDSFSLDKNQLVASHTNMPDQLQKGMGLIQGTGLPASQRIVYDKGNIWIQNYNQLQNVRNSILFPGYRGIINGVNVGADYEVSKNIYAGAFAGTSYASFDWKSDRGSGNVQNYYAGLYVTKMTDSGFYADCQFSAGLDRYNTTRVVAFDNLEEDVDVNIDTEGANKTGYAHHNGYHLFAQAEVGQEFSFEKESPVFGWKMQPFANIAFALIQEQGYTEHNADSLSISVRRRESNFLRFELGFSFYSTYIREKVLIRPEFRISYSNTLQLGGNQGQVKANLVGLSGFFIVQGEKRTFQQITPSLAVTVQCPNNIYFAGNLSGELGKYSKALSGMLTLGYNF